MIELVYKKSIASKLFVEDSNVLDVFYKGVTLNICINEDNNWLSIWLIDSKNSGKGEVQEAIDLLRKDYPDKEFYGSIPLNDTVKHIFIKKNIKFSE